MEIADLIRAQPSDSIFSSLSEDDWHTLIAQGIKRSFKRKAELLAQGEIGDKMLILLEGTARVAIFAANGREIVLAYAGPGAVLGEIAMLDEGERTASVHATSTGIALEIRRPMLREFITKNSDFAWLMMQCLARRLRQADQTIENDRAYASGARLARCLQRLIQQHAGNLYINLNQSELGNFAGMSREHINRQLKNWEEAGVVALDHGRVQILDPDMLEDISESDC